MKTSRIIALAASLLLAAGCSFNFTGGVTVLGSCTENGCDYAEERETGEFRSIASFGPFNVHFIQSGRPRILVEGTEESVSKLHTDVKDGELQIRLEDGTYRELVLKVTVWAPEVSSIRTSGSGDIIADSDIRFKGDLSLKSAGSGDIHMKTVSCDKLECKTAGSGDLYLGTISCSSFTSSTSGSGDLEMKSVRCDQLSSSVSGSGDISISEALVSGRVELRTAGSGDIHVNGRCDTVSAHSSGSGDISGRLEYRSADTGHSGSGRISL